MTNTLRPSPEIDGNGRTVRELLSGRKCSIDYYQRDYKWQRKQVAVLLDDLSAKFLRSHEEGNECSAVEAQPGSKEYPLVGATSTTSVRSSFGPLEDDRVPGEPSGPGALFR